MPSRTRVSQLKLILQDNIFCLCTELGLGAFVREGDELRFGRKGSLSVSVETGYIGIWRSFEAGEGGDVIDLVSWYKDIDFVDTMRWVEAWVQYHDFGCFGVQGDE